MNENEVYLKTWIQIFFNKKGQPRPQFLVLCPYRILQQNLNSWPIEHEASLITTKLGLQNQIFNDLDSKFGPIQNPITNLDSDSYFFLFPNNWKQIWD